MPPPSPKAKMLESVRIPDGEGMPSPYNMQIRYAPTIDSTNEVTP